MTTQDKARDAAEKYAKDNDGKFEFAVKWSEIVTIFTDAVAWCRENELRMSGKNVNPIILERDRLKAELAEANARADRNYDGYRELKAELAKEREKLKIAVEALGWITGRLDSDDGYPQEMAAVALKKLGEVDK